MEVALGYFEEDDHVEYDLSQPPMTGIDYLKRVQREAANCPDVVVATQQQKKNKPYEGVDQTLNPNHDVAEEQTIAEGVRTINMTKDYPEEKRQLKLAEEFAYLRQKFNRVKSNRELYTVSESTPTTVTSLPKMGSQQVLGRFCYGKDFVARYTNANLKGQNADQLLTNVGAQGQGTVPLLGLMLKLKQSSVLKLLNFNFKWLDVLGFSYDQGVWIYALLVCLDKPLPSEMSSTIRDLCRRVIDIRNRLAEPYEDDTILHQMNLIIVLITRFFGQPDLLDDILANSSLHTLCYR